MLFLGYTTFQDMTLYIFVQENGLYQVEEYVNGEITHVERELRREQLNVLYPAFDLEYLDWDRTEMISAIASWVQLSALSGEGGACALNHLLHTVTDIILWQQPYVVQPILFNVMAQRLARAPEFSCQVVMQLNDADYDALTVSTKVGAGSYDLCFRVMEFVNNIIGATQWQTVKFAC